MGLFRSVPSLRDSGLMRGLTDWHSHILPGVDDGIQEMEDALEAIRRYEELGVGELWLTPHIMEDFPNSTADLRRKFEELRNSYDGPLKLNLAAENMLDPLFEKRLADNDFLPLGNGGKHLLVETSYMNPPYGMDELIEEICRLGYTPVLAHPERYRYMEEDDYRRWKERGLFFQANLLSIVGSYGETARKKLEWLLKERMVDLLGSDLHRIQFMEHGLRQTPRKNSFMDLIREVAAKESELSV